MQIIKPYNESFNLGRNLDRGSCLYSSPPSKNLKIQGMTHVCWRHSIFQKKIINKMVEWTLIIKVINKHLCLCLRILSNVYSCIYSTERYALQMCIRFCFFSTSPSIIVVIVFLISHRERKLLLTRSIYSWMNRIQPWQIPPENEHRYLKGQILI